ncbi:apolipoprotein acyltransferase [Rhodobacteraceae bacterium F11138]|nr:apolipoprotein acyltransferase [Rhodobacteraceae bacterium F11138]
MIVIAGIVSGAIIGALIAKRRGGKPADLAQHAAAAAMAFGVVAMIATVLIDRLAG